jgi:hypothetical protein
MHAPGWHREAFRVSDYVTPNDTMKVRFTALDNPNDACVEALVDDFMIMRCVDAPPLWANAYSIPVSKGAVVDFQLDAGMEYGERNYLLLGSVSGTEPGMTLPGGAVLPLNWDGFTTILLGALGSPMCQGFMGQLDASGRATATLDTLGPVDPTSVGQTLYFAYLLGPEPFFASNAIEVTLIP